ncbi:MAG: hypothetical protein ACXAD7_11315 [Candidatus Kariarchaeaceae archaeon]|jgi:hypothetical protein
MRKSSFFVLGLLVTSFMVSTMKSSNNVNDFNDWRPGAPGTGCHSADVGYTHLSGSVIFNSSWVTVEQGNDFTLAVTVTSFDADLTDSDSDVTVGFNVLDEDNSVFTGGSTMAKEDHKIDVNGDSETPYLATFTAPDIVENYTLVAYAVAGSFSGPFYYVNGQVRVTVVEPTGPQAPKVSVSSEVIDDNANFTLNLSDDGAISLIEFAVDDAAYEEIILTNNNSTYILDISSYSPGNYTIKFKVTDDEGLPKVETLFLIIAEPVTTTDTTDTTDTTSQTTDGDDDDAGPLGNIVSVILVSILFIGVFITPVILSRRK